MRALIPLCLALAGCLSVPGDSPAEVFDQVWLDFDAMYGGFDQRGVDWDDAYDTWSQGIEASSDEDAVFAALSGLLGELDDGHVRLVGPNRTVFESNIDYREQSMEGTFDIDVVRTYLDDEITAKDEASVWGTVQGVPYIWLPWIHNNTYVIEDVAEAHPDANSVIVDLRHSHGGTFTFPFQRWGILTQEDLPVFRSRSRDAAPRGSFDSWRDWTMKARSPHWGPRVVVLTDRVTISATERLAMMLYALDDTVFVGVPTNGAAATAIGREASNRWTYQLPVQEVEAADGSVFEGPGLPVDVEILNDPADVENGQDAMLEAALVEAMK